MKHGETMFSMLKKLWIKWSPRKFKHVFVAMSDTTGRKIRIYCQCAWCLWKAKKSNFILMWLGLPGLIWCGVVAIVCQCRSHGGHWGVSLGHWHWHWKECNHAAIMVHLLIYIPLQLALEVVNKLSAGFQPVLLYC